MTLRLVVVEGESKGAQLKLHEKSIVEVGSAPVVDLRLADPEVAGVHLKCYREGEGFTCLDVSGRGFVHCGHDATRAALEPGDVVRVGSHVLQLLSDEAAPAPSPSEAVGPLDSPTLLAIQGNDRGKGFKLDERPVYILGRGVSTDITLWDIKASRAHCRIDQRDGGYVVSDLNSSNGTYLNDELLREPRRLADGDTIRVGSTVLRFAAP